MSWQQLMEWAAYAEIEPFGEERADRRTARAAFQTAAAQHGKPGRPIKESDFMLDDYKPKRQSFADAPQAEQVSRFAAMKASARAYAGGR